MEWADTNKKSDTTVAKEYRFELSQIKQEPNGFSCGWRRTTVIGRTCVADFAILESWTTGLIINKFRNTTGIEFVHRTGRAVGPRRRRWVTRTFLKVSFFPGGCHIYPHLDEAPAPNPGLSHQHLQKPMIWHTILYGYVLVCTGHGMYCYVPSTYGYTPDWAHQLEQGHR